MSGAVEFPLVRTGLVCLLFLTAVALPPLHLDAQAPAATDWPQFRGPNANGRSLANGIPLTWSDDSNLAWKTELPGPGASSPITVGNRVFLTCYTGYTGERGGGGQLENLQRHLVCLDLSTGKILWNTAVQSELPEQDRIREDHGYASSTPVTDGTRVYAFFGKAGVFAFDFDGKQLWRASVGSNLNGWGSATSPVLAGNLLLVNASVESGSLVALDKTTGKEVWRAQGVNESWHAPVLVKTAEGRTEIVIAMLKKLVAFDPANGKQLWNCDTGINWYMCPTPLAADGVVYSVGGRNPNGGLAVRAGGSGDVTESHVLWKVNRGTNVPSPILHGGHLYFAHENLGVVYCVDAKTGRIVFEERLSAPIGQIYASPVLVEDRIYFTGRGGRTIAIAAKPKLEILADNVLENNRGVFNASPAVAGGKLLIRSNRALYCIGTNDG